MPPSKRLFVQTIELTYQGNNIYFFTCFNHWIYWPLNTNFFLLETVMRQLENSNLPAPADLCYAKLVFLIELNYFLTIFSFLAINRS